MGLTSWGDSEGHQRSLANFVRIAFAASSNVDYSLGNDLSHRLRLAAIMKLSTDFIERLANECCCLRVERSVSQLKGVVGA
jgi:hypothetical protein